VKRAQVGIMGQCERGAVLATCIFMLCMTQWCMAIELNNTNEAKAKGDKCKLKVEYAEWFDVLQVSKAGKNESDMTVLLNIKNKLAYALDSDQSADDDLDTIDGQNSQILSLSDAQEEDIRKAINDKVSDGEEYQIFGFRTPLINVEISETQLITYVELLGARDTVSMVSPYTASSCLQKMISQNKTGLLENSNAIPTIDSDNDTSQAVQFVGYLAGNVTNSTVQFAVSAELAKGNMMQTSEWIKFFAPFFNQECKANEIFDKVKERYNCHKQKALDVYSKSNTMPVVAVANKNPGYDCGGCEYQSAPYFGINDAQYYTEYIQDAGGKPLVTDLLYATQLTDTFGEPDPSKGGFVLNTTEQFQAALANVDILIDTSYMENATLEEVLDAYNLSTADEQFNFIKNKAIWRTDRRVSSLPDHGSDWFESRYPEADVLLEDLIYVIHPEYPSMMINPQHQLTWFRNMFSSPSQVFTDASMCLDEDAPSQLIADDCSLFKS